MKILPNFFRVLIIFLIYILTSFNTLGQSGIVKGKIIEEGTDLPLQQINVFLQGTALGDATDKDGNFRIVGAEPGKYVLKASGIGYTTVTSEVTIENGKEIVINFSMKIHSIDVGEVLVYGASFRKERITDAPSSISIINAKEIERFGSHGQLAKLLEMEPGVDIAQSGLFDFNINTRGFNSSLNRRLLILLDGRDLGTAFLGATEWNGLSVPLEELGSLELVRGPGSALYGANAFNGVINITSLRPSENPGTRLTLSGGESSSFRGDIRYAAKRGNLEYRFNLGGYQGKSFATSRKDYNFEYTGLTALNNEQLDLATDPIRSTYASGRIDYTFEGGSFATVEGGLTQVENEIIVTGIGRVQVQKATKPYLRLNYNGNGLNAMLWTNGRNNVLPEKSLATGLDLIQNAWITHAEVQYNFSLLQNKLFVVTGASHRFVNIDTKQTLMLEKRNDNVSGIFAQMEYKFTEQFKSVAAVRWDRSSLHDDEISPKVALVYSINKDHTVRATYNRAFQSPNYSEQYLYVKSPPTIPPFTTSTLYMGNPNLITEKITGYEIGYKGILFDSKVFLTLDGYFNKLKDFITDLGPTGGEPLVINNIRYALWSYNNAGEVNEYGYEVGINYYPNEHWIIDANYSNFKFDIIKKDPKDYLLPNSPDYKINFGLTYLTQSGHDISAKFKYVPTFPWAAGIFRDGVILAYTIVNIAGTYKFSPSLSLNLNISNLFDRRHYEILGGSILRRRALITLTYSI